MSNEQSDVLKAMRVAEAYCYEAGAANAARNTKAARAAVAELIESADHYMQVGGSTHGQPARERLRAALVRVRSSEQPS